MVTKTQLGMLHVRSEIAGARGGRRSTTYWNTALISASLVPHVPHTHTDHPSDSKQQHPSCHRHCKRRGACHSHVPRRGKGLVWSVTGVKHTRDSAAAANMDTHIWWLRPVRSSSWEDCTQHSSWLRRMYNYAGGVRDLQSTHVDSGAPDSVRVFT